MNDQDIHDFNKTAVNPAKNSRGVDPNRLKVNPANPFCGECASKMQADIA